MKQPVAYLQVAGSGIFPSATDRTLSRAWVCLPRRASRPRLRSWTESSSTRVSARLSCVVQWTTGSLQESGSRVTLEPSRLSSGFPPSLQTGPAIGGRLEALVSRWPDHTRLVEQVPFSFGKGSKERTVLVIALAKMDDDKFEKFRQDYLDTIGFDTVSFPCRLRAEHLRARVGTLALALSAEGVRVDFYAPPLETPTHGKP